MTWVDLGDGLAIDASRVGDLQVCGPWPPSYIRIFAYLEQLTWTVRIHDNRTNVVHHVACYWAEADARAHARRVVAAMQERAA